MKLAICAALLLVAFPASADMVKCKKADGSFYYGPTPPEGCEPSDSRALTDSSGPSSSREQSDVEKEIRANCAAEWPDDFAMQKHCIGRQADAFNEIRPYVQKMDSDETLKKILTKCWMEWPGKTGGRDYAMMNHCTKRQLSAYKSLQR